MARCRSDSFFIELNDCRRELKDAKERAEKESRARLDLQLKGNSLAEMALELKRKVAEFDLVKKVLGNEKVSELVECGKAMEEAERQQRERDRQFRRSRNRGMSL